MSLKPITAEDARVLVEKGTRLIDIRERDEHARERIAGAQCVPASALPDRLGDSQEDAVIFHCKSGMRTQTHATTLAQRAGCTAYMIEGGLEAWKRAGLPVEQDRKAPVELMRQVQMTAGGLVLAGVLLGAGVNPGFYGVSAFVGAGLFVAGATGWCGMARLLGLMPWNRAAVRAAS